MMESKKPATFYMRTTHRYLGFFLAGIMAVYALSGVVLIFRDTNIFKKEKKNEAILAPGMEADAIGKKIKIRDLKFTKTEADLKYFDQGVYNNKTGLAQYTSMELPFVLNKLTQLHKASVKDPLYYFNIFFAVSLLFFVVSAFWMFKPNTSIFKKGLYFTLAGFVLLMIMLYV